MLGRENSMCVGRGRLTHYPKKNTRKTQIPAAWPPLPHSTSWGCSNTLTSSGADLRRFPVCLAWTFPYQGETREVG